MLPACLFRPLKAYLLGFGGGYKPSSDNWILITVLRFSCPAAVPGEVLLNLLRAHAAAYSAIRALPNGGEFKVGWL